MAQHTESKPPAGHTYTPLESGRVLVTFSGGGAMVVDGVGVV